MSGVVAFVLSQGVLRMVQPALLLGTGIVSFIKLNIEAYPDPVPPLVDLATQRSGQSAEEIERLHYDPDRDPNAGGLRTTPEPGWLSELSNFSAVSEALPCPQST
jgi:hypothetical protein